MYIFVFSCINYWSDDTLLDNGEPNGGEMWLSNSSRKNHFHIGYGRDSCSSISVPYLSMYLFNFNISSTIYEMHRSKTTRKKFLIYLHSNCVPHREDAFLAIAKSIENATVYFGGKCHGLKASNTKLKTEILSSNNIKKYHVEGRENFHKNEEIMQNFRFCLVMENTFMSGYVTEKILNAFLGGCIPIYYGTDDVFKIFNENAFIFFNISNPSKALKRIAFLENNKEAFNSVIEKPILRHPSIFNEYLNLNGRIKEKIREMVSKKDTCN